MKYFVDSYIYKKRLNKLENKETTSNIDVVLNLMR